jgi:hypothetical protein
MGFGKIRKGTGNQVLNFPENCRGISNIRTVFGKIRKGTVRQTSFS